MNFKKIKLKGVIHKIYSIFLTISISKSDVFPFKVTLGEKYQCYKY